MRGIGWWIVLFTLVALCLGCNSGQSHANYPEKQIEELLKMMVDSIPGSFNVLDPMADIQTDSLQKMKLEKLLTDNGLAMDDFVPISADSIHELTLNHTVVSNQRYAEISDEVDRKVKNDTTGIPGIYYFDKCLISFYRPLVQKNGDYLITVHGVICEGSEIVHRLWRVDKDHVVLQDSYIFY